MRLWHPPSPLGSHLRVYLYVGVRVSNPWTVVLPANDAAVDSGIHFAVAAGNDNADACNYSLAASANAITAGASAINDSRAYL